MCQLSVQIGFQTCHPTFTFVPLPLPFTELPQQIWGVFPPGKCPAKLPGAFWSLAQGRREGWLLLTPHRRWLNPLNPEHETLKRTQNQGSGASLVSCMKYPKSLAVQLIPSSYRSGRIALIFQNSPSNTFPTPELIPATGAAAPTFPPGSLLTFFFTRSAPHPPQP